MRLCGAAEALRARIQAPLAAGDRVPYDRLLAELHAALDPATAAAERQAGGTRALAAVVAEAVGAAATMAAAGAAERR
jgi:hypothetical protein